VRLRASTVNTAAVYGAALFLGLALFFCTVANLTHTNCCTQEWVNSASDPATREVRAEARARSVTEAEKMKRHSQVYSLSCLGGAVGLAILYYSTRRVRQAA
jgi:hypothetical protein